MVKKKEVTGFLMGYINQRTYSYKLEITTTDGIVIKGEYEDEPDKYRPGDFVKVSISKNKIDDLKILDRALMDSHY